MVGFSLSPWLPDVGLPASVAILRDSSVVRGERFRRRFQGGINHPGAGHGSARVTAEGVHERGTSDDDVFLGPQGKITRYESSEIRPACYLCPDQSSNVPARFFHMSHGQGRSAAS